MVSAVVEHMQANKVKSVGYIGFSDSWGDANYNALKAGAASGALEVTTNERYARADTAVTGQMLKVLATNPDAIFVSSASGRSCLCLLTTTTALSARSAK